MTELARRGFLLGLMAAPAIVRASSIMPVRPWSEDFLLRELSYSMTWIYYSDRAVLSLMESSIIP